jgi:hypothetical protein
MAKARVKAAKVMPTKARRPRARQNAALPASLPPQATTATSSTLPIRVVPKRDRSILPPNSVIRQKVLLIIGLRLQGKSTEEIATELGLKPATINQYMFFAGRNGWLKKTAIDPSDRLEHEVMHKVVRNIDEALDSPDEERRDRMTVKAAEGVLFQKYKNDQSQVAAPITMIGVRIEMPNIPGQPTPTVREGTTGGEPLWKEGEVSDESQGS